MKKSIILISIITLIIVLCFSGCYKTLSNCTNKTVPSDEVFVSNSTQEYSTEETSSELTTEIKTTSESTIKKNSNSGLTSKPAERKSVGQTTTTKVTTTQKSTTTQRQTTTQKVTTTQKQTTTKKVTTTSAPYWCDEGGTHHSCEVGQIGWVSSYEKASDKAYDYLGSHNATGNFRVKQCHMCGKFTAYITLD